jgi:hypothetical protein
MAGVQAVRLAPSQLPAHRVPPDPRTHVERGVTAICDRASYDQEKRQAVDKLARYLKAIVASKPTEKVVELRPA